VPPDVAVAIVSYETRELLLEALDALHGDVRAGRAEVWVVDNASTDGSADAARAHAPWAHVVDAGANIGFGPAVNVVARATSTPWVLAANADTAPTPEALSALLAAGRRHPVAGALGPKLVRPDGTRQHSAHPFPTLPRTLAFNLGLHHILPGLGQWMAIEGRWDGGSERTVDWLHGAWLLVRRRAWDDVGGFDEAQWMYAEDLDLGWRLHQRGWRTVYVPSAEVIHHVSAATSAAFGEERLVRAQARAYAWMLRRRGLVRTRAVAIVNLAGVAVRLALLGPRSRPDGRRAALHAWGRAHRTGLASTGKLRSLR
jgi:N-acetylglucosaminyl-diphospho-decaprenol L-rhamnosyltransferase